jgi:hypothetical protein
MFFTFRMKEFTVNNFKFWYYCNNKLELGIFLCDTYIIYSLYKKCCISSESVLMHLFHTKTQLTDSQWVSSNRFHFSQQENKHVTKRGVQISGMNFFHFLCLWVLLWSYLKFTLNVINFICHFGVFSEFILSDNPCCSISCWSFSVQLWFKINLYYFHPDLILICYEFWKC